MENDITDAKKATVILTERVDLRRLLKKMWMSCCKCNEDLLTLRKSI
jgi:hypothetical protein